MTPRSAAKRGPRTAALDERARAEVQKAAVEYVRDARRVVVPDGSSVFVLPWATHEAVLKAIEAEAATAAVPLDHGDHVPAWKWCYFGLTIAKAEAQGVSGHRFCEGCARLSADEEGGTP